jgi:HD-GYP domain-containing protein (c-di-GMP phosphodiesterase class II)
MADILKQQLDASKIILTPEAEETEGYSSLPLQDLIVGKEVFFDVYLKIKDKGKTTPRFVKCCSRGEVYQEEWHEKLVRLQIPCFYFDLTEKEQVLQYLQKNLESMLADDTLDKMEKGSLVCDTMQMWTLNFFNSPGARTATTIKQSLQFLDVLTGVIEGDRDNLLNLMKVQSQKSLRLYTHCLNVALLGMAFTGYLGWSPEKIRAFGLGALLHDIGLVRAPQDILEKRGKLTQAERWEIRRHPIESHRLVKGFANLPMEALEMILQHHENGDGSGYPSGLRSPIIHSWARILRILDSYEAMTAARPWRAAMTPHEALEIMLKEWENSKVFDQNYLRAFIKFLAGQ